MALVNWKHSFIGVFFGICSLLWASWAGAVNTHGLRSEARERAAWFSDADDSYIFSGCIPAVPVSSLTIADFACRGYVEKNGELVYVDQAISAITLPAVNGNHWLLLFNDRTTNPAGWSAAGLGTHYRQQQAATRPADPAGGVVFAQVTVAGAVITVTTPFAYRSATDAGQRVYTVTNWGAACDGITDDTLALIEVIDSNRTIIFPRDTVCMTTGVSVTGLTNFKLTGGGTIRLIAQTHGRTLTILQSTEFIIDNIIVDGNKANQVGVTADRINDSLFIQDSARFNLINSIIKNGYSGSCLLINNSIDPLNAPDQLNNAVIAHNLIKDCGNKSPDIQADGFVFYCDNCNIHDNIILNATDVGLVSLFSKSANIHDNQVNGNESLVSTERTEQCIATLGTFDELIHHNTVEFCQLGIMVTLSANPAVAPFLAFRTHIDSNIVKNISGGFNGDGIGVAVSASLVKITNNTIFAATRGIVATAPDSTIRGNTIQATTGIGIFVGGARSRVSHNIISVPGGNGIFVQDADSYITENTITNLTVAPGIDFNSNATVAYGNTFATVTTPFANATLVIGFDLENNRAISSYNGDLVTRRDLISVDANSLTTLNMQGFKLSLVGSASSGAATAGGGQAVPATVASYISVDVNGVEHRIPLFLP